MIRHGFSCMIKKVLSPTNESTSFPFQFEESRARNDRQTVFAFTRELVHAQFELADQELTRRLWQEISARKIDIERVIYLMYGCSSYDDEEEMLEVDLSFHKNRIAN